MKKKISALMLALTLLLSVPVQAAQDSMANFVRQKTYVGQFSDLSRSASFYDNITAL